MVIEETKQAYIIDIAILNNPNTIKKQIKEKYIDLKIKICDSRGTQQSEDRTKHCTNHCFDA
jgi:hypothetical protein